MLKNLNKMIVFLLCSFIILNTIFAPVTLALAPYSEIGDPYLRSEYWLRNLEVLDRLIFASEKDDIEVLDNYGTDIMLLSHGRMLARESLKGEPDLLFRKVIHEQVEAILQIMAKEDFSRYSALMNLILSVKVPDILSSVHGDKVSAFRDVYGRLFPEDVELRSSNVVLANHIIAKVFELKLSLSKGLRRVSDFTEEEMAFFNLIDPIIEEIRYAYFGGVFWDDYLRESKIRVAISNGFTFFNAASGVDTKKIVRIANKNDIVGAPFRSGSVYNNISCGVIRKILNNTRRDIGLFDEGGRSDRAIFLKEYYEIMASVMDDIEAKVSKGDIDPLVKLNTIGSRFHDNGDEVYLHESAREINVGFMAITGNPLSRGHVLAALSCLNSWNLDTVVFRVQGEIDYKKVSPENAVSAGDRHLMVRESIRGQYPLLRYTDLGAEAGSRLEGGEEAMRFLELNKNRRVRLFYLIGAENEERMWKYMRLQYDNLMKYSFGNNPNHKFIFAIMQRGEYGTVLPIEHFRDISRAVQKEKGCSVFMDVAFVEDNQKSLKISSTAYRDTHDDALVPRFAHNLARLKGYYGHSRGDTTNYDFGGRANNTETSPDGVSGFSRSDISLFTPLKDETAFTKAVSDIRNVTYDKFISPVTQADTEAVNYEFQGQGIVLYADDILANAMVIDLEYTFKHILCRDYFTQRGKVVLYAKNAVSASILEGMIRRAAPGIDIVKIFKDDIGAPVYEDAEFETLARNIRAKGVRDILAVLKGPCRDPETIGAYARVMKMPVITFGFEDGIYSFADAIKAAVLIKKEGGSSRGWLFMLSPITDLSNDIKALYENYKASLASLIAA